jgi:hypothetical protein
MYDNVTEAAGRVVDQLSRRRFVGWLGKGGLALAGALGFDKLGGGAFARSQTPCAQLPPVLIPVLKGEEMKFSFCTTTKHCEGLSRAFDFLCASQVGCEQGQCAQGQFCDPKFMSADHVVGHCEPCKKVEQDCGNGELKCCCTVRVKPGFKKGTLTCPCGCVPSSSS